MNASEINQVRKDLVKSYRKILAAHVADQLKATRDAIDESSDLKASIAQLGALQDFAVELAKPVKLVRIFEIENALEVDMCELAQQYLSTDTEE